MDTKWKRKKHKVSFYVHEQQHINMSPEFDELLLREDTWSILHASTKLAELPQPSFKLTRIEKTFWS